MKAVIVVLLSVFIAAPALAGPPVNGTYKSTDIGGPVLVGHYSESWFGGKLSVNNTLNEQSWDGATLGTQWQWYCPYVAVPPVLLQNNVDANGNGQKTWLVTYAGGVCWFAGTGAPWDGGDAFYTANVMSWSATVTETFSNFIEVGTIRSQNATAQFVGYNDECLALTVSNLEKLGDTTGGPMPADFPNFLDGSTCSDLGTAGPGEWGDIDSITFSITGCVVRSEERSWGAVKALYR